MLSPSHPALGAEPEPRIDAPPCPNCGSPHLRSFCPDCGQAAPAPGDYSLRAYLGDLACQLTNTEGRAARTIVTLIAQPGVLTVDHLAARRARYLRPLQIFLLANVLLFVAAPRLPLFSYSLEQYLRFAPPSPGFVSTQVARATPHGHSHDPARGGAEFQAYAKTFDARVEAQRKSLVVLLAPALALVLHVLFARQAAVPGVPRRFGEHLVFALHLLAFFWLVLAALGGITALVNGSLGLVAAAPAIIRAGLFLLLAAGPLYALGALRRVYHLSWRRALAATAAMTGAFLLLLLAYRGLLFFTTYYTL